MEHLQRIDRASDFLQVLGVAQHFVKEMSGDRASIAHLPSSCRDIQLKRVSDLMFWWLEFDRVVHECQDVTPALPVMLTCRDLFCAAWDRALVLGYKMGQVSDTRH
jgi:hypothetical protein